MKRRPLPTKPTAAAAETPLSPATFAFAATRIAAAQIIHSAGYRSAQSSALDTLADAAGRYLSAVASSAAATAASDARTQSNLHDVIVALETLAASAQGFTGASNLSRRILSSSTLTDLSRFVRYSEEIPFSQVLRWRPGSCIVSGSGRGSGSGCGHIPKWLPAVPDMGGEREVERGERLYGCLDYNKMRDGIIEEERKERRFEGFFVDEKMRIELPKNREKLRFKIGDREGFLGVNLRNGVSRKRISCENRIINYGDNDDKDTNMKVKCNSGFNGSEEVAIVDRLRPLLYYRRRNRR